VFNKRIVGALRMCWLEI